MCRTGCPTKDHKNWGECLKAANLRIAPNGYDTSKEKKWDSNLEEYRRARKQGIQPVSTNVKDVRRAVDVSQQLGRAFDAGKDKVL